MAIPFIRIADFSSSTSGDGSLVVSMTAFDDQGIEIPGIRTGVTINSETLMSMVSALPDQPTMRDAYDLIIKIASKADQRYGKQALEERIAFNKQAVEAKNALAAILGNFGLPTENVDVPLRDENA